METYWVYLKQSNVSLDEDDANLRFTDENTDLCITDGRTDGSASEDADDTASEDTDELESTSMLPEPCACRPGYADVCPSGKRSANTFVQQCLQAQQANRADTAISIRRDDELVRSSITYTDLKNDEHSSGIHVQYRIKCKFLGEACCQEAPEFGWGDPREPVAAVIHYDPDARPFSTDAHVQIRDEDIIKTLRSTFENYSLTIGQSPLAISLKECGSTNVEVKTLWRLLHGNLPEADSITIKLHSLVTCIGRDLNTSRIDYGRAVEYGLITFGNLPFLFDPGTAIYTKFRVSDKGHGFDEERAFNLMSAFYLEREGQCEFALIVENDDYDGTTRGTTKSLLKIRPLQEPSKPLRSRGRAAII